jgi:hypothetical protein
LSAARKVGASVEHPAVLQPVELGQELDERLDRDDLGEIRLKPTQIYTPVPLPARPRVDVTASGDDIPVAHAVTGGDIRLAIGPITFDFDHDVRDLM